MRFIPGSETSQAAAESIADVGQLQARVFSVLLARPSTDEEVQDFLGMNPSTERPRRVELVEKKLVRDSGRRRPTRSGRLAVVWEPATATPASAPEAKKPSVLERLRLITGSKK